VATEASLIRPCFRSTVNHCAARERGSLRHFAGNIAGADGWPYSCGCFIFDIYLPPTYPNTPPKLKLLATAVEVFASTQTSTHAATSASRSSAPGRDRRPRRQPAAGRGRPQCPVVAAARVALGHGRRRCRAAASVPAAARRGRRGVVVHEVVESCRGDTLVASAASSPLARRWRAKGMFHVACREPAV
jgi:Ubiquitin-conjugating enzyme